MDDEDVTQAHAHTRTRVMRTPTHTVYYHSALMKNEILPFITTRMNLEDIRLSEISKVQKDK